MREGREDAAGQRGSGPDLSRVLGADGPHENPARVRPSFLFGLQQHVGFDLARALRIRRLHCSLPTLPVRGGQGRLYRDVQ